LTLHNISIEFIEFIENKNSVIVVTAVVVTLSSSSS